MPKIRDLPVPYVMVDYRGAIRICYDDGKQKSYGTQPVGPIQNREGCKIIIQAIDNGQRPNGPPWIWLEELDHGRGSWVTYDPRIHDEPEDEDDELSAALPEAVAFKPISLNADTKVELESEIAPTSDAPEVDDDEDGEPFDEDEDEDVIAE